MHGLGRESICKSRKGRIGLFAYGGRKAGSDKWRAIAKWDSARSKWIAKLTAKVDSPRDWLGKKDHMNLEEQKTNKELQHNLANRWASAWTTCVSTPNSFASSSSDPSAWLNTGWCFCENCVEGETALSTLAEMKARLGLPGPAAWEVSDEWQTSICGKGKPLASPSSVSLRIWLRVRAVAKLENANSRSTEWIPLQRRPVWKSSTKSSKVYSSSFTDFFVASPGTAIRAWRTWMAA